MIRPPTVLAVVAASLGVAAGTAAAAPISFSTCAGRAPVQCGTLEVPLDHAAPGRGTLSLHVERLATRGSRRGVLVLLAGGPGQAGTPIAPDDPVAAAIPGWDLVMLDQRGTGKGALTCPALDGRDSDGSVDAIGRCAVQLGPDRALYATRDSVLDLESLRDGLGVPAFALGGISYGTYVTQYYAQRFPSRVTHLVMDSVVDPATFNGLEVPFYQRVAPALRDLCARRRCRGITPDPVADISALVQITATRSIRGMRPTETGRTVRTSLGGPGNQGDLPALLAVGDLSPTARAMWPGAARAARTGDPAPLLRLSTLADAGTAAPRSELSSALFYATTCADMTLPWTSATPLEARPALLAASAAQAGPAAFAPFTAANAVPGGSAESCARWPDAAIDPLAAGPLPAVPTLLMDGGQDLRTPVESARAVAARAPLGQVLVAPGAGHSLLYTYACARTQLRNVLSGRRVSTAACNREAPVPTPIPVPPATLGRTAPSGAPGTAGRVAAAARRAIQDGVLAMDAATEAGLDALPGIRGGLARPRGVFGEAIAFSRFSAVRGVSITGTLRFNGSTFQGAVRVNGPGAWDGTLTLARGGQRAYTGTIGGVAVRIPLG